MPLDRRHFLKYISLGYLSSPLALTGCTHQKFHNPDQDIILGGGRFKQNGELRHVLSVVNLQQNETRLIDLDFLAHGIVVDPNNKQRLITFEKSGSAIAEVDLDNQQLAKTVETSKEKLLSGHGAFNKAGDTLFCCETYLDDHRGIISIRDASSLALLGEFSSHGENPHECLLINDGTTLVITNAGSTGAVNTAASVTYIDVQSQNLKERVTLSNKQLNAGHIGITKDGSLIVSSAPVGDPGKIASGGVSIRSSGQSMLSMTKPEAVVNNMTGESLSVAVDNKNNIAAVTHPDSNMVTFWSIDKRELLKAISVPLPKGVALSLDGKSFIISYDINTSCIRVTTKNLSADKDSIMQPTYISGEHIYNWSKILTQIMPTNIY